MNKCMEFKIEGRRPVGRQKKYIYTSSRQHIHALQTTDTDIHHCIQHITNIPHSVLTGDVNANSTLWHLCIDDHRGQLIADVISNSDHITQQPECQTLHYKKHIYPISPRCLTHYTIGHRGQHSTHYYQTIYPSLPRSPYNTTRLQQNRQTFTNNKKADWT